MSNFTYTIALTKEGLLAACADQYYDIKRAVKDEEDRAGVEFDGLEYIDGLTLTDELIDGDEVVFESGKLGWLSNADDSQFAYAVRRAE